MTAKVKVDGQWCIVMERKAYSTKVLTPMHEVLEVSNKDIEDSKIFD